MQNYRNRLAAMAEGIAGDAARDLLQARIGSPGGPAALAALRQRYGLGEDSTFARIYAEMDGVQILWNRHDRPGTVPAPADPSPLVFLRRNIAFDGVINLLPLEVLLDAGVWKGTLWFDEDPADRTSFLGEETDEAAVRKRLLPFDLFSVSMSMAAAFSGGREYVLLLQDYHLDWRDSRLASFADYLDFLLATEGRVQARSKTFNTLNGHGKPVLAADQLLEAP